MAEKMKDPAALIYIDKWISSTNGMKAEFRAWYFDLLIYQYDKGTLPNDMDELAGICRVRPSEYNLFEQMLKQVLKQKFKQNEEGEWFNEIANEIISKRKNFKEKRAKSGTIGAIIKKAMQIPGFKKSQLELLKSNLYDLELEDLEQYKSEDLLKHLLKLYINVDVNEDEDVIKDIVKGGAGGNFKNPLSLDLETLKSEMKNEFSWKESLTREYKEIYPGFKMEDLENYMESFFKLIGGDGEKEKTVKDFKKHFNRWTLLQLKTKLNNGKSSKTNREVFESGMESEVGRNFRFK